MSSNLNALKNAFIQSGATASTKTTIAQKIGTHVGRTAAGVKPVITSAVTVYRVNTSPNVLNRIRFDTFAQETELMMTKELRRKPTEDELVQRLLDTCDYVLGVSSQTLFNQLFPDAAVLEAK